MPIVSDDRDWELEEDEETFLTVHGGEIPVTRQFHFLDDNNGYPFTWTIMTCFEMDGYYSYSTYWEVSGATEPEEVEGKRFDCLSEAKRFVESFVFKVQN